MRTLLLDRDGVINLDSRDYIRCPDEWQPVPGSLAAIVRAQRAGYRIIVVSNQSGLARGLFDMRALNAIHRRLQDALERLGGRVDAFFFCPHGPDDGCACRKPAPGLLLAIQARLGIDLAETHFIGDRVSDADAAQAAGARAVLVRSGIDTPDDAACGTRVYDDLAAAVDDLV